MLATLRRWSRSKSALTSALVGAASSSATVPGLLNIPVSSRLPYHPECIGWRRQPHPRTRSDGSYSQSTYRFWDDAMRAGQCFEYERGGLKLGVKSAPCNVHDKYRGGIPIEGVPIFLHNHIGRRGVAIKLSGTLRLSSCVMNHLMFGLSPNLGHEYKWGSCSSQSNHLELPLPT